METPKNEPWNFCETPEKKCTMNYCDDNGCQNRKRALVNPVEQLQADKAELLKALMYVKDYLGSDVRSEIESLIQKHKH